MLYNTDELTKTGGELRIVKTKETLEVCEEILEEAEGKTKKNQQYKNPNTVRFQKIQFSQRINNKR